MRQVLPLVILLAVTAATAEVAAQPGPPPTRRPVDVWDSRGWQMLGEQTVNGRGREDRDRITVGRDFGKFDRLMVVVLDGDLEMIEMRVNVGKSGEEFRPAITHYFREGTRTRSIDLPGEFRRTINFIDFRYRNLPGGGRARVQVWAKADAGTARPPAYTAPSWDSRGWTMIGEQTVNGRGREDNDRITVGRDFGKFDRLMVVVHDGDLEMIDMRVSVGRSGAEFRPAITHYFREGTRTRSIDLPGEFRRTINYIDFRYRNLPGGGRARVQVWAKADAGSERPAYTAPSWDSRGWTMIGEQTVNGRGREDSDRIIVGRDFGKFERLMLVVFDSDLELTYFNIAFRRGDDYQPPVTHYFREGTRTRSIDLPGDRQRTIKHIDLRYRNLPGGGKARVQIWGK